MSRREVLRLAGTRSATSDISWIVPTPAPDGFSLAPDALRFLAALVAELRPRHILEFGAGVSTRVLARAAAESGGGCTITSIENDPEQARLTAEQLEKDGTAPFVRLILSPLVLRRYLRRLVPAYAIDPRHCVPAHGADLILIDGPPDRLGGRLGMIYQALEHAEPGAIVLLDDADRVSEAGALDQWEAELHPRIDVVRLPGFTRGLAAVLVTDPTLPEPVRPSRRLETSRSTPEAPPDPTRVLAERLERSVRREASQAERIRKLQDRLENTRGRAAHLEERLTRSMAMLEQKRERIGKLEARLEQRKQRIAKLEARIERRQETVPLTPAGKRA